MRNGHLAQHSATTNCYYLDVANNFNKKITPISAHHHRLVLELVAVLAHYEEPQASRCMSSGS